MQYSTTGFSLKKPNLKFQKIDIFWIEILINFAVPKMVVVAQLVRASDCDSEGRGFEPHHPPKNSHNKVGFLL